jgi:hypothetical protein
MNDTAELERRAEAARAKVADTAETIRNRLTPGQLIDEFSGLFSGSDGGAALANLKAQIRDNPLPVALVGTGLAWLMFGSGGSAGHRNGDLSGMTSYRPDEDREAWPADMQGKTGGGISDAVSNAAGAVSAMVSDAADSVRQAASDAADKASSLTGDAARATMRMASGAESGMAGSASSAEATARDMLGKAKGSAQDLLGQEPLVLAALGLAVGTAIGAMLPSSELEDAQVGRYRDKLRDSAKELFDKGVEGAKEVAAEAYQTVKDEADKQGLQSDGRSVVDQVGSVIKSAAAKTEEVVRDRIGDRETNQHSSS